MYFDTFTDEIGVEFKWKAALWKITNRCDGISKRKHFVSVVIWGNFQAANNYEILNEITIFLLMNVGFESYSGSKITIC